MCADSRWRNRFVLQTLIHDADITAICCHVCGTEAREATIISDHTRCHADGKVETVQYEAADGPLYCPFCEEAPSGRD